MSHPHFESVPAENRVIRACCANSVINFRTEPKL